MTWGLLVLLVLLVSSALAAWTFVVGVFCLVSRRQYRQADMQYEKASRTYQDRYAPSFNAWRDTCSQIKAAHDAARDAIREELFPGGLARYQEGVAAEEAEWKAADAEKSDEYGSMYGGWFVTDAMVAAGYSEPPPYEPPPHRYIPRTDYFDESAVESTFRQRQGDGELMLLDPPPEPHSASRHEVDKLKMTRDKREERAGVITNALESTLLWALLLVPLFGLIVVLKVTHFFWIVQ